MCIPEETQRVKCCIFQLGLRDYEQSTKLIYVYTHKQQRTRDKLIREGIQGIEKVETCHNIAY